MKAMAYGVAVDGQLILQEMYLKEDTAFKAAHQVNYDRFYKDNIQLVECAIVYQTIKQISQPKGRKLKKRKKLRRRLNG